MGKIIRIENWSKINGITYKGFVIGSPSHSPNYEIYNCNAYDLNNGFNSNSSIWVTMNFDEDINAFNVTLYDVVSKYEHTELLPRAQARVALGFVKVFEALIDQYIYDKRNNVGGTTGVSGSNGLAGSSNFNKT